MTRLGENYYKQFVEIKFLTYTKVKLKWSGLGLLPLHFLMHSVKELYNVEHASEVFKITLVIYIKHWRVNTEAESTPLREEE